MKLIGSIWISNFNAACVSISRREGRGGGIPHGVPLLGKVGQRASLRDGAPLSLTRGWNASIVYLRLRQEELRHPSCGYQELRRHREWHRLVRRYLQQELRRHWRQFLQWHLVEGQTLRAAQAVTAQTATAQAAMEGTA